MANLPSFEWGRGRFRQSEDLIKVERCTVDQIKQ